MPERAAPTLLKLGVPLRVSHMFVFYFGIMADLTPPVALAAFAAAPVFVPVQRFTLAWLHSIEKLRLEEDYVVASSPVAGQPPMLLALKARVKGSAAGMEPPDDAVLRNGWYEYTPHQTTLPELRLTRSEFTADYDWCVDGRCQIMANLIASDRGITRVKPCFGLKNAQ